MIKYVHYENGQFSAFEFHCNIAKQLIKCESFCCKYTVLFHLYAVTHFDNMKFLSCTTARSNEYVCQWAEQFYKIFRFLSRIAFFFLFNSDWQE